MSTSVEKSFTLRSIGAADMTFLASLYASTRATEMAAVAWPEVQKKMFLQSQFELQHKHYQENFSYANFHIVEIGHIPVGRFYYGWESDSHAKIIDIALLPEYQRQKIGSRLMENLLMQVAQRRGTLTLHVEIYNPVRNWYLRLGFVPANDDIINGIYQPMIWRAPSL